VTWEILSGRPDPYFEVTSTQDVHEIESRLSNLPESAPGKEEQPWPGAYMFVLPGQQLDKTRVVSVGRTKIQVRTGSKETTYADAKSLRKYLDELKSKYKLVSADGFPVP
jgi:tRNA A37 threonylcarbamoyladenosine synthetase subunit TsaC/SUA5/YrdC